MKPIITLNEVKRAIRSADFRRLFPELSGEFEQYMAKPGCAPCVRNVITGLLQRQETLLAYFGDVELDIVTPEAGEAPPASANIYRVINCHIDKLEEELSKLPPGPKQIAAARWSDQITIIVNDLG
jgi:hypothetical protein